MSTFDAVSLGLNIVTLAAVIAVVSYARTARRELEELHQKVDAVQDGIYAVQADLYEDLRADIAAGIAAGADAVIDCIPVPPVELPAASVDTASRHDA